MKKPKLEKPPRYEAWQEGQFWRVYDRRMDLFIGAACQSKELAMYVVAYFNEEVARGNQITEETERNAVDAFMGGAR